MTIPDSALRRIEEYCEAKTRVEMRAQMRFEVRVRGNSISILDARPPWDGTEGQWIRESVAQLRFDPAATRWTLHWADSNSRWHRYDGLPATADIENLLSEIERDPTCIFWG